DALSVLAIQTARSRSLSGRRKSRTAEPNATSRQTAWSLQTHARASRSGAKARIGTVLGIESKDDFCIISGFVRELQVLRAVDCERTGLGPRITPEHYTRWLPRLYRDESDQQ